MSVTLSTRGILCSSSPSVGRSTWGVICNPLTLFIPSFVVGPQVFSPEVVFNKTLDIITATTIVPRLTSPVLDFISPKEPEIFDKGVSTVTNKPEPDLISPPEEKLPFNKEDPDIFNKEDPKLVDDKD